MNIITPARTISATSASQQFNNAEMLIADRLKCSLCRKNANIFFYSAAAKCRKNERDYGEYLSAPQRFKNAEMLILRRQRQDFFVMRQQQQQIPLRLQKSFS
jgi:hypothetical protein